MTTPSESLFAAQIEEPFYGLRIGDDVFAHGHGIGKIVDAHRSEYPSSDRVTVESKTTHECSCGHRHERVERWHLHPQHVSLTPTGRALRDA